MTAALPFIPEALELGDLHGTPEERSVRAREYLQAARDAVADSHAAGAGGRAVCAAYAAAVDQLVGTLFRAALARHGRDLAGPVALAGTGGFGRSELCPYSDVDLLFLHPPRPDAVLEVIAQEVLYPLWDAGLTVGHAVRTLPEAVTLARADLTVCTALLDMRLVGGDAPLYQSFVRDAVQALFTPDANELIARLGEEVRRRRARFGETPYLLEPNLKHGDGGLRDLNVGLWAAKARFRIADFPDLVRRGEASTRQVAALTQARELLLRVRTALHLHARRCQDQLGFEAQEAIARRLFPDVRPAEGDRRALAAVAVEELLRRVYLSAKAIRREVDRLLERCVVPPRRPPVVRRVDGSFTLFNGRLSTAGPEVFRERPGEMVRLFAVALEQGCEIYGHTRDLVADRLGDSASGAAPRHSPLAGDHEAARQFLRLLVDPRDTRAPSLLEQMHDLGVLGALMPEFAPLTGRAQHDLYHVYTVDQHSLYAVMCLKALARGETPYARSHPTAVAAMREVGEGERVALYLGTLLHDVGKPLGKGHAEKGARLAAAIARRLGLGEGEVERVELLVRHHLLLSHLSQRRDIDDGGTVTYLAHKIGDVAALRQLYLLSFADMSMVAPGNLTEWKATLLRDLYQRARAYLRAGPDLAGADTSARVRRRKRRVAELVGLPEDVLEPFFRSLPDRYFAQHQPRAVARHVALCRRRATERRRVALDVRHNRARGYSVVTVCTDDAPGLLASITGVLVAHRIDVHAAQIHSRVRAGPDAAPGEALDVFTVHDRLGRAIVDAERWRRVEADLDLVVRGEATVEDLIAARRQRSALPRKVTPTVLTEVEIDNEASQDLTVVDVYTQDRLGVLYTIARTLAEQGLDIQLSKVATEAARVADAFYVRDRLSRAKITDPERLARLSTALYTALERLQDHPL